MLCVGAFGRIADHCSKALLGILNVGLVVATDAITERLINKAIRKLPLSRGGDFFDHENHVVVERLLLSRLTFRCA
jgi:hypothetical protein